MAVKNSRRVSRHRRSANWTFLSNHTHVLLCIALEPESRIRDVAPKVGITERAVQRIVADLVDAGYLSRHRSGRCNRYHVDAQRPLRHPLEAHQPLRALLSLVMDPQRWDGKSAESHKRSSTRRKRAAGSTKGKVKE